jgi:hypothetical protein
VIGFGHIWDNQTTCSKLITLSAVTEALQKRYLDFLHKLLFNDNRVIRRNKLRTYRKIKTDFKGEQYLYADADKISLSNLIKIRVSNCILNIEKGRYLKLPVEQRICQLCHTDVEDEFHFLMNCDKLIHKRVTLFRNISNIVPSFKTMSDVEKFMFLLNSHDLDVCKVVILGVSNMYLVNQSTKQNL